MTPDDAEPTEENPADVDPTAVRRGAPGSGRTPEVTAIEPDAPDEFGLVSVWWGDGKGKTTAALGMAMRAAGHGFRVHLLQFMKGGADSVESVRGEYNAIAALPGFTYENAGHYGWHGMADGSDDADLSTPFAPDSPPEAGVHLLVLDEVLYAAERDLVDPDDLVALVESKPDDLELVLTGGHTEPTYLAEHADLVSGVRKASHPMDEGQRARRGTEF